MDLHKLKLNNVSLKSKGRQGGTSYTSAELSLARQCALLILTASGYIKDDNITIDDEIKQAANTVVNEAKQKGGDLSVPGLTRALYRHIERSRLLDSRTRKDFPKKKHGKRVVRDHTSIGLLIRRGLNEAGVDQTLIDKAFPSAYRPRKSQ